MTTQHPFADPDRLRVGREQVRQVHERNLSVAGGNRLLLKDLLRLCRPKQWTKNVFVISPLVFSPLLITLSSIQSILLAVGCFCLWSSGVYLLNDVIDAENDRKHPTKCKRPVAARRVSPRTAIAVSLLLTAAALVLATVTLPRLFLVFGAIYLANSLMYCVLLKTRVIADVISLAIGFVLRLMAGCAAIGVEPSSWIVVCGFSLALLLAFGKRRAELVRVNDGSKCRVTLKSYSEPKLDAMLSVSSAICLLSYMLYTVAPATVAEHHTDHLVYTIPFVAYGIFRYVFLAQEGNGDGPTEILLDDRIFLCTGLLWAASVLAIIYTA